MALSASLVVVPILIFLLGTLFRRKRLPPGIKELPGPKGWPIIGSMLDVPAKHHWLKFKEWGDVYGPIYKLNTFGTTHVVVSSDKIAEDLLALRGAIYSDRANLHMLTMLTDHGDLLAAPSNDYWRRGRKFAGAMLTPPMAVKWEPFQAREARRLTLSLLKDPLQYQYWLERYTTAVSVREGFGHLFTSKEDEQFHVKAIQVRQGNVERFASAGLYLVELFPWLMYLPTWLAPFKQEAKRLHHDEQTYFAALLSEAIQRHKDGTVEEPPSFARNWLAAKDNWNLSHKEIVYVIGTMYGGGAGTTSAVMKNFLRAICLYPEWLPKLQAEVDAVVGPNRVPEFADIPMLPTVRAAIKECMRWRPVVPGNMPHRLTKDDYYNGYCLPKGALVHANTWSIKREAGIFTDPEDFNPGRWLDPNSPNYRQPLQQFPNLKRDTTFGWGRRICPGLETAERSLQISIATMVWACHITKKKDASGKELDIIPYDKEDESFMLPKDFPFSLTPRSESRTKLLAEDVAQPTIPGSKDRPTVYE